MQVQEYFDYRKDVVDYYAVAYRLNNGAHQLLATQQIINLAAIHHNVPSIHWGNRSIKYHPLLKKALEYASQLAYLIWQKGYRGELGIDFGMTAQQIFFLEANGRVSNATRAYEMLLNQGLSLGSDYIFVKDKLVAYARDEIDEALAAGRLKMISHETGQALILPGNHELQEVIYDKISQAARQASPVIF